MKLLGISTSVRQVVERNQEGRVRVHLFSGAALKELGCALGLPPYAAHSGLKTKGSRLVTETGTLEVGDELCAVCCTHAWTADYPLTMPPQSDAPCSMRPGHCSYEKGFYFLYYLQVG